MRKKGISCHESMTIRAHSTGGCVGLFERNICQCRLGKVVGGFGDQGTPLLGRGRSQLSAQALGWPWVLCLSLSYLLCASSLGWNFLRDPEVLMVTAEPFLLLSPPSSCP